MATGRVSLKISIAMCTYNGQRYLQQQLQSFLEQSHLPDELVICDDGSTDQTVSMLQAFAASAPFPVRIVRNPSNLGSTRNFLQAMSLCTGDLIALSDQDDIWRPEKLAILSQVLEQDRLASAAFSDAELIDAQSCRMGRSLWDSVEFTDAMQALVNRGEPLRVLQKQYFITGATMMFRAELRSLFPHISPDWIHDAWMSWKFATSGRLVSVALPLIEYRIHSANQVGVNTSSVPAQLKRRNAEHLAEVFEKEIGQLATLREDLAGDAARENPTVQKALRIVDARTRYLHKRVAAVRRNRAARSLFVLALWRQYSLYGKGWRSLLADLVL